MPNTNKIVKITNGKILNYKISAPNYKTIYGSQLITADTTINRNMVAEVDPNGVYSLGDRIGDIASFVCYFNSTNPETNVDTKYAVFVLDAKYRTRTTLGTFGSLTYYDNGNLQTAIDRTISATYNNNTIINSATTSTPAVTHCRQFSITLGGNVYQAQLPNMNELYNIWQNRTQLDTFDPTVSDYTSISLTNWGGSGEYPVSFCSNYESPSHVGNSYTMALSSSGDIAYISISGGVRGVVPVFEIPVE